MGFDTAFVGAYNAAASKREGQQRAQLAWAQMAEQREERYQREADAGKAAEYFFKANPDALMELGVTEKQFANMSARQQSAAAMGFVSAQAQKQVMQQLAQAAEQQAAAQRQLGDDEAAMNAFQRASTGTATLPSPSAPGMFPDMAVQTTQPPTSASVWQQFAQQPRALRSSMAQPFLRSLAQGSGATDPAVALNAKANMMNAEANFNRAQREAQPAPPAVAVRGYTPVPDGRGGYQYLRTQPSAQQQLQISRLQDRAAALKLQIAAYDSQLTTGNKKSGADWMPGKGYDALKQEAQAQLDEINAQLRDLVGGQEGAATGAPAAGNDLWSEFMNAQK